MAYASAGVTAFCWLGLAIWFYPRAAHQNSRMSVVSVFSQLRGRILVLGVVLVVVLTTLMRLGSQMSVSNLTSVDDMGQAAVISAWAQALFSLLVPLTFLSVMLSARVRMRDTVTTDL